MKLKFKTDGIVNGVVEFKAGEIYEISDDKGSATRWIKRGAEVVVEESKVEPVVSKVEAVVASEDEALAALGGEEQVVNEESKKENKREKKSSSKA